ncbi:MAG: tellurite resistance TerB family protein [Geminicoccaceae bacterium]
MVDFKSVLGTLLESGLAPSASQRLGNAANPQQGGGLAGMFGGAGGGLSSMLGGGKGGSDIGVMLGGLLGNAQGAAADTKREVQAGNPMAVGGLGALAGALLGGVRGSPAKGAIGGAALAVLGQIAMSALQKSRSGAVEPGLAEASSAPVGGAFTPASVDDHISDQRAELLLKAMINAAKADGQIDGTEMNNILGKLDEAGADSETRDFVLAEMRRPLDLDGLVAAAGTPDLAAAVYAASVMAIKVDTPAEQTYLSQLATRLNISPAVRSSLDASLGVGRAA